MYTDLPAGQLGIAQMWSGDIINAQSYLPEGTSTDILRYWFPDDGKGLVDNDMMVVLRSGKNPVLAHLFLNHMLDPEVAMQNFTADWLPAAAELDHPDSLVQRSSSRRTSSTAIVRPEYSDAGLPAAGTRSGQRRRLAQRLAGFQSRRVVDA